jgi:hypothetical protein
MGETGKNVAGSCLTIALVIGIVLTALLIIGIGVLFISRI